jgi:hypothetical protein
MATPKIFSTTKIVSVGVKSKERYSNPYAMERLHTFEIRNGRLRLTTKIKDAIAKRFGADYIIISTDWHTGQTFYREHFSSGQRYNFYGLLNGKWENCWNTTSVNR